jgi:hypothetical protein
MASVPLHATAGQAQRPAYRGIRTPKVHFICKYRSKQFDLSYMPREYRGAVSGADAVHDAAANHVP